MMISYQELVRTFHNHSTHYAMAVWQLGQAVALARVQ